MKQNILSNVWKAIRLILQPDELRGFRRVNRLVLLSVLFDAFSLILVLPILSILTAGEFVGLHRYWGKVYKWLGFHSQEGFLLVSILLILVCFCIKNLLGVYITKIQARYAHKMAGNLSRRSFCYYFSKDFQFFKNTDSGFFVTNIMFVPAAFASGILLPFGVLISEGILLLLLVLGMAIFKPMLFVLIVITLFPIFGLIYQLLKNRMHRIGTERNLQSTSSYEKLQEALNGYMDAKQSGSEKYFLDKYFAHQTRVNDQDASIYSYSAIPSRMIELAAIAGVTIIVVFAFFQGMPGKHLLYLMGIFTVATFRLIPSVNRITASLLKIKNYRYTIDELVKVELVDQRDKASKIHFENEIEIKNLAFRFEDSQEELFRHFNLALRKGTWTGLKGESGVGKSTLLQVLAGLMPQTEGAVLVDGKVRQNIQSILALARQDSFVFNSSLEENITMGLPADSGLVAELIAAMHLNELQDSLGDYFNGKMGEKGSKLSGGQKQRIALARALYRRPQLLLLDEATNSLDKETEENILQYLKKLSATNKLTVLLISHHHTPLEYCDEIIELKN